MRPGNIVNGVGNSVVSCATGALVKLLYFPNGTKVLVGGRVVDALWFYLPASESDLCIISEGDWSLEWYSVKPGYELPDPTPIAIPVGADRPETLSQTIARMVRRHISDSADASGFDTENDEDYDDDDDDFDSDPTPYEYEEIGARMERELQSEKKLKNFIDSRRKKVYDRDTDNPSDDIGDDHGRGKKGSGNSRRSDAGGKNVGGGSVADGSKESDEVG